MESLDRYSHLRRIMGQELFDKVQRAKLLVVGAGGIGCELLKNLVMSGFMDIVVVDLDTIDKSNLNRQFLFRPQHINQSKALMAREAVLKFNPDAKIVAYHGNVKEERFGLKFVDKFDIVLNALDNVEARRHVNRLCLAQKKPLIESGTTGYVGQVTVISKGETECYECQPKATQKQYPICTIRSTPSKPVHCVVWAKQLFMLLFGKAQESMLYEGTASDTAADTSTYMDSVLARPGAGASDDTIAAYTANVLKGLFSREISKQLGMDRFKGADKTPVPLEEALLDKAAAQHSDAPGTKKGRGWDRGEWGVEESAREFSACVHHVYSQSDLRAQVEKADSDGGLCFDKDDLLAMRFVTAATNLRSRVFQIPVQSFYDCKGVAGNIIPAIATTNAIIAGLQVAEALKILKADKPIREACRYMYCMRGQTRKGLLLQPTTLAPPSSACYVCGASSLEVFLDCGTWTLRDLVERVLKGRLGVNQPSVGLESSVLYEEGEGAEESLRVNLPKLLKDLPEGGITDGTIVEIDDFSQDLSIKLSIFHKPFDEEEVPEGFTVSGESKPAAARQAKPQPEEAKEGATESAAVCNADGKGAPAAEESDSEVEAWDAGVDGPGDDDEVELVEAPTTSTADAEGRKSKKRSAAEAGEEEEEKHGEREGEGGVSKRAKTA